MTYYVVYMAENATGSCTGTITIKLRRPIKTADDVTVVADIIKEEIKSSKVLVLNWKELKENRQGIRRIRPIMNGLEALRDIKKDDFPVMIAGYPPMPATLGGYTKDELFSIVEKELMLFRTLLKIALSDDSDRELIQNATEEDIREAYRNDELPKKEELSADDWVKLFGIAKEALK